MTTTMSGADGPPRVQRPLEPGEDLPVLHLEDEVPRVPAHRWALVVDGHVDRPQAISLPDLVGMESAAANWDFHCVWGWSKPLVRWTGVRGSVVASLAGIRSDYVQVTARTGIYSSALTLEEFCDGIFATHRDGHPLTADHGGPLRFVPPPHKWAYKGVKWAVRVTATTDLTPGLWESLVGDVAGDIPPHRLDLAHEHQDPAA